MTLRDTYQLCSVSGICLEGGPLCKHDTFQPKETKFGTINRLGWACFNGRQFPATALQHPRKFFFGFGPAPLRTPTQCNIVTMFFTVTELREGQLIFGRRCAVCRNTAILACRMSRLLLAPAAVAGPAHAYSGRWRWHGRLSLMSSSFAYHWQSGCLPAIAVASRTRRKFRSDALWRHMYTWRNRHRPDIHPWLCVCRSGDIIFYVLFIYFLFIHFIDNCFGVY